MAVQIQLRNDTAANWTSANPTLAAGEMGVETDTDQFKLGDGLTAWNSLGYGGIAGTDGDTGVVIQAEAPTNTNILWLDSDDPAGPILVPSGGTTGQVLAKASGDDYDSEWVTDADIPLSTVTAAGDLIVADGASSVTNLSIGTADQVLTTDGTNLTWESPNYVPAPGTDGQVLTLSSGVATWEDAAGGGLELITSGTLSNAVLLLTGIPSGYKDLRLYLNNYDYSNNAIQLRINNYTSEAYGYTTIRSSITNSSYASFIQISDGYDDRNDGSAIINFFNYADSSCPTTVSFYRTIADSVETMIAFGSGGWYPNSALTSIRSVDTFVTANYELYGVK